MNWRKIFIPLGIAIVVFAAFRVYGMQGILTVSGGLLMWGLLHFTRLMSVMQKAAKRPIGYVGSAVMLNARLAKGVNLMHVVAMTQALGERVSAENAEPEVYRWTDGTHSHVTCEFQHGKLVAWTLVRPQDNPAAEGAGAPPAGP